VVAYLLKYSTNGCVLDTETLVSGAETPMNYSFRCGNTTK